MSDEIIKVLDNLAEKFGIVIDWTSQNVLPYLQELCDKYINYEIWTSVVYLVICLLVFVLLLNGMRKYCNDNADRCFLGIIMFIPLIVAVFQIIDIVTALTFPEKLIYEYISLLSSTC